jgi:hypothetical protein
MDPWLGPATRSWGDRVRQEVALQHRKHGPRCRVTVSSRTLRSSTANAVRAAVSYARAAIAPAAICSICAGPCCCLESAMDGGIGEGRHRPVTAEESRASASRREKGAATGCDLDLGLRFGVAAAATGPSGWEASWGAGG